MQQHHGFWRWYGLPVAASLALLGGLNFLYNLPDLVNFIGPYYFLYTAVVLMAGGSLPALLLLWRSSRAGLVALDDLGLGPAGWTAPRRLAGVVVVAAFCCAGWLVLRQPPAPTPGATAPPPPTWEDLSFWFAFLLSSSLAELLVFIGLGFCLLERGLRGLGMRRSLSTAAALLFSSVTFGLYHYTHPSHFYPLVFPLMGEMFLMVVFFRLTRNFYLTFVLHNLIAAVGFAGDQSAVDGKEMSAYVAPASVVTNVVAFVIPFVLLHALEWWVGRKERAPGTD